MTGVTSLRHFGLVVHDIERALYFYTNILGLRAGAVTTESGEFINTILDHPDVCVQTVKLKALDGETVLELLHFVHPASEVPTTPIMFNREGPTHVAFTVNGIVALLDAIESAGGTRLSNVQISPDGKVCVAFCRDMEGNLLELVEPLAGNINHVA